MVTHTAIAIEPSVPETNKNFDGDSIKKLFIEPLIFIVMEQNNASNEAQIKFSDQFEVKKWLQGKNEGTAKLYTAALKTYIEYTKLSPKQLIDLSEEDRHKSARLQGDPEQKVLEFYQYLTTDYVQKRS
jgi:hypothetical protein